MVAIGSSFDVPHTARAKTPHTATIVVFALQCSALLVAASFVLNAGHAWGTAATMTSRFATVVFALAMVVEPIGRLFPVRFTQAAAQERSGLMLGFVVTSFVSLGCLLAPSQLHSQEMSVPAVAYAAFTSLILIVMLFSSHPATVRLIGAPVWRSLQRIAMAYFWMVFVLIGIDHMVGPHRPDGWHGFAVLLLVGALLIRFADAFMIQLRAARQPKAVWQ